MRTLATLALVCAASGATIGEATSLHRLSIIAHHAGGTWRSQPDLGTPLGAGDRIQVMVTGARVAEVHALNVAAG